MKAQKTKDLKTLPQYFSLHGYHTLSSGKIFHKHPLTTDKKRRDALDHGEWAFDEWVHEKGGISPKGKDFPLNGLPSSKFPSNNLVPSSKNLIPFLYLLKTDLDPEIHKNNSRKNSFNRAL